MDLITITEQSTVVVDDESKQLVTVVSAGPQGPPGPEGSQGPEGPAGPAGSDEGGEGGGGSAALEWLPLPMVNGAHNFGSLGYGPCEYALDADYLHLRGLPSIPAINHLVFAELEVAPTDKRVKSIGGANGVGEGNLITWEKGSGDLVLAQTSASSEALPDIDGLLIPR